MVGRILAHKPLFSLAYRLITSHSSHCNFNEGKDTGFRDGPLEKWWGWGKNLKKIHTRENAKKKKSCKEEGKKIHAEGRSNCDFFRKSEFLSESLSLQEAIEIWFHVTGMWYFYGQRRREEFKKALEGALKFFPGIKIKPEQELCFQGLVV